MVEKMSFKLEDDSVLVKCKDVWNEIKKALDIKFHCKPVYDEEYIKAKVKTFNGVVNTIFGNDKIPKEHVH